MSATFYVSQRTKVNLEKARKEKQEELIALIKRQITALPQSYSLIKLSLELDGEKLLDEKNQDLENAIANLLDNLESKKELLLEATFIEERNYVYREDIGGFDLSTDSDVSPFLIASHLRESGDEILSTIEHNFYLEDEQSGSDERAFVFYYGFIDNKPHMGVMEEREIKELENDDFWLRPIYMPVGIEDFKVDEEGLEKIQEFVDSFKGYYKDKDLTLCIENNHVTFDLNGHFLKTKADLETLLNATSKLVTDLKPYKDQEGFIWTYLHFQDYNSKYPRKIRIQMEEDGSYKFYQTGL